MDENSNSNMNFANNDIATEPNTCKSTYADSLNEELVYDLADLFKVFSDSTRIRILVALFDGELCVSEIAEELEMSQTAISHQLRILKQNHLIKYRRQGKSMIYSLADEHVKTIINCATEHVEE